MIGIIKSILFVLLIVLGLVGCKQVERSEETKQKLEVVQTNEIDMSVDSSQDLEEISYQH